MHPGRRNFWAVWLALFTTSMGLMAFLPVLALYVEEEFGIREPREVAFWASVIYGVGLGRAVLGRFFAGRPEGSPLSRAAR